MTETSQNREDQIIDKQILLMSLIANMTTRSNSSPFINENFCNEVKEIIANEIQKQFNNQNVRANQSNSQLSHCKDTVLDFNILTKSNSNRNNSASDSPLKPFAFLRDRRKYIVAALIFILALIIIAAIYGRALTNGKSTLRLVTRNEWLARPHRDSVVPLNLPVERVIVSHTASDICKTLEACIYRVSFIQNFHMDSMDFGDIGYNFLLGSDGRVYEGRGWDLQGAHTKGYNTNSLGISFIGTYNAAVPNDAQLQAFRLLIDEALRLKKLVENYKLYGARQFAPTESPGLALYKLIKTWPHWTNETETTNV